MKTLVPLVPLLAFALLALLLAFEVHHPLLPVAFERSDATGLFVARASSAAWSFAALVATYAFLARTLSPRAARYAVVVLATSPIVFVSARTALGPMAMRTAAAALIAFSLVGLAALDGQMNKWLRVVSAASGAAVLALAFRAPFVFAAVLVPAPDAPTFEAPVAALAYGMAPWSPFVPFAIATRPRNAAHVAIAVAALVSTALASLAAPTFAPVAAAFLGLAVAVMLASLDRARRRATLLAVSVATLAFLVVHDLGTTPARMIDSVVGLASTDAQHAAAKAAAPLVARVRGGSAVTAAIAFGALVAPRAWLPFGRGAVIAIAGGLAGLALRIVAYPPLLARLSPSTVVEAWHAHRETSGPTAPLGLLGVGPSAVVSCDVDSVQMEHDAHEAARWLVDAPASPRRFVALAASSRDLPRINAVYRDAHHANVPVLVAGDETTWLLASALHPGETSVNPFDRLVTSTPPPDERPLDVHFDTALHTLGWQLTDDDDRSIAAISRKDRHAHLRVAVHVDEAVPSGLCTFLHIDHTPSRFADEHRETSYPMDLWRRGDTVIDDYDVTLPSHFGKGMYKVYWGFGRLPCQDDHRLPITSGPSDGHDRAYLGTLEIR